MLIHFVYLLQTLFSALGHKKYPMRPPTTINPPDMYR
jgi:hypothetical protein